MKMLIKFFAIVFGMLSLSAFAGTVGYPIQFQLTGAPSVYTFSGVAGSMPGLGGNDQSTITTAPVNLNAPNLTFSANVMLPSISSSGLEIVGSLIATTAGNNQLNINFTPSTSDYTCQSYNQAVSPSIQGGAYYFNPSISCAVTPPPPPVVTTQNYNVALSFTSTDGNSYVFSNANLTTMATAFSWANTNQAITPTFGSNEFTYAVPTTAASMGNTQSTNIISFPITVAGNPNANYSFNAQFENSGNGTVTLVAASGSNLPTPTRTTCSISNGANTYTIGCTQAAEPTKTFTYQFQVTNTDGTALTGLGALSSPWGTLNGQSVGAGNYEYSISATQTAYDADTLSNVPFTLLMKSPGGGTFTLNSNISKTVNGLPTFSQPTSPDATCTIGTPSTGDQQNFLIPVSCSSYTSLKYTDSFKFTTSGAGSPLTIVNNTQTTPVSVGWAANPATMAIDSGYNLTFSNSSAQNGYAFTQSADSQGVTVNINLTDGNGTNYIYPVVITKTAGNNYLNVEPGVGSTVPANYNCSLSRGNGQGQGQSYSLNCAYTPNTYSYLVQYSDSSTFPNYNEYQLSTTSIPSITFPNSTPAGATVGKWVEIDWANDYVVSYNGATPGAPSGTITFPLSGGSAPTGTYYIGVQMQAGSTAGDATMTVNAAASNLPPDITSCSISYPGGSPSSMYFRINCLRAPTTTYTVATNIAGYGFQQGATNLNATFANAVNGAVTPSFANYSYTYNITYKGTSPGASNEIQLPLFANGSSTAAGSVGVTFTAAGGATIDNSRLPSNLSSCQATPVSGSSGTVFTISCVPFTTTSFTFVNNWLPSSSAKMVAPTFQQVTVSAGIPSSGLQQTNTFVPSDPINYGSSPAVLGSLTAVSTSSGTITFNASMQNFSGSSPAGIATPVQFVINIVNGVPAGAVQVNAQGSGQAGLQSANLVAHMTAAVTAGGQITINYK